MSNKLILATLLLSTAPILLAGKSKRKQAEVATFTICSSPTYTQSSPIAQAKKDREDSIKERSSERRSNEEEDFREYCESQITYKRK